MPVGLFKWLAFTFVVAAHADLTAKPLVLRGGATPAQPEQYKTGKTWTTASFTRDHVRFMKETPSYLGAYINPFSRLDPKTIESVMVTMNSINTCPYCTGLHGQVRHTHTRTHAHACTRTLHLSLSLWPPPSL